ncbi:MAG: NAD-dependent epimerase/dehydratase family protein [Candidatus Omnitrophica bacterium]|nr:NAD-dependent epimerase/dehydratase family protein [Candidatus Omnitrophota bacterium]
MEHILITGGCGFIGSQLAVDFASQGHRVTVFDNLSRCGSEILLKKRIVPKGIRFVRGDVRDPEGLGRLRGPFSLLIECSAEPSVLAGAQGRGARRLLDINLQGALHCFEWARERKVPVIFLSTSRVYPYDRLNASRYRETPTRFEWSGGCDGVSARGVSVNMPLRGVRSLYGASKLCGELILREYAVQYGLPAIINRCGVIAGPWQLGKIDQGVFTHWLTRHYFKRPLSYIGFGGTGKQVRDLLHVRDLSVLIAKQARCLFNGRPVFRGEIFNVGGGKTSSLSLRETTSICAELTGNTLRMGRVKANRPADVIWYITDNGRTERLFGWEPRGSARNILEDTFVWLRDNEPVLKGLFSK